MELIDNRFRIIKKIYTPEIADTYLTEDTQNGGALVDVKILLANKYISNVLFNMFKSEVLVIKELKFNGIPEYITSSEVEENGERYFYVASKHIEGKTLKELITDNKKLIDENFFKIGSNLLKILEYLESKKVIHKSINPENIIIDDNLNVFLINFGAIRNKLNSGRTIEPVIGNINLMPNEQKLGFTTGRSDQYALGIVFVGLISQNMVDTNSVKDKSVIDNVLKSITIDENLRSFLKIMINNDSTERFQSIKHALEVFNKISNGEEVEIKVRKVNQNKAEDDYIANQIVKNELFYAEIDNDKYRKKNRKSYKMFFYLMFFVIWGYILYHFLGSLMTTVEKPRRYNGSYRNHYRKNYKKVNTNKKRIILDTYKRSDFEKGKK